MAYQSWSVVFGEQPSAAKWNILGTNDSYFDSVVGSGTAWTSWTPTWTGITIGNATVVARYTQIGKTVHFHIAITVGSTTTLPGGGDSTFTLPITATSTGYFSTQSIFGRAASLHSGTTQVGSVGYRTTTTAVIFAEIVISATGVVTGWNTSSVAWTTGDTVGITGTYETA